MPYPNAHLLLRASGHFGSGTTVIADKWSTGLRFGVVGADVSYSPGSLQTFVDAAWTAFLNLHSVVAVGAGNNCYLDATTVARVGLDGKYDPATQQTVRHDGPSTAGGGTPSNPWNTAHVISLRTAFPRGYASNGRMYYPCLSQSPASGTGRLTTAQVTARLASFKTLVESLNAAAATYSTNCRLMVYSSVGSGLSAKVTSLRADERLDSIERRENDIPANYSSVSIVQV